MNFLPLFWSFLELLLPTGEAAIYTSRLPQPVGSLGYFKIWLAQTHQAFTSPPKAFGFMKAEPLKDLFEGLYLSVCVCQGEDVKSEHGDHPVPPSLWNTASWQKLKTRLVTLFFTDNSFSSWWHLKQTLCVSPTCLSLFFVGQVDEVLERLQPDVPGRFEKPVIFYF